MADQSPELDYQPRQAVSVARWQRLLLKLTCIGVALVVLIVFGIKLYKQVRILRVESKLTAIQLAGPVDSWIFNGTSTSENQSGTPRTARLFREYMDAANLQAANPGFLFFQRRRSPGQQERIVVVMSAGIQVFPGVSAGPIQCTSLVGVFVIEPGGIWSMPHEVLSTSMGARPLIPFANNLSLMPGLADPKDQSHFTFDVQADEQLITVDGWLRADDSVLLQPRPPVPIPTPTSSPASSP